MISYFKTVDEIAEWLSWTENHELRRDSFVRFNQVDKAKKAIEEGGYLLSYIKGIKCWAGVFKITGKKLLSSKGSTSWDKDFPNYFEVEPIHELRTPEKCFLARESKIKSGHDGRGSYNHILDHKVCERISSRIKIVAKLTDKKALSEAEASREFEDFKRLWDETRARSAFTSKMTIKHSGGRCSICWITKHEWIDRIQKSGNWPQNLVAINRIRDSDFEMLDAHHYKSVRDGGTASVDNLDPVCPNCHNLLTRAGGLRSPR